MRSCTKGVAEGFTLQEFAHMPTGQGRVGLFLLFSFHLEVLDRILVLRGLGPAGKQLAGLGWPEGFPGY